MRLLPSVEDDVICLSCRSLWTAERAIGSDYRHLECPVCGEQNSELEREADLLLERFH